MASGPSGAPGVFLSDDKIHARLLPSIAHQYSIGKTKAVNGSIVGTQGEITLDDGKIKSVSSGPVVVPGDVVGYALRFGKFVRAEDMAWGNVTYRYERGSVHVNVVVMPPRGGMPNADTGRYLNRAVVVYESGNSRTIYYYERKRVTYFEP